MPSASSEVVIATFDNPRALDLCLGALRLQDRDDFTVCVADDGSGAETRAVIERWREVFGSGRLRHVWQPNQGFRKNVILNQAIRTSAADYLIFLDGDCVASPGFVRRHLELRYRGRFLTGGVVRLNSWASSLLSQDLVRQGRIFSAHWLWSHGCLGLGGNWFKAGFLPECMGHLLETFSPVKRTWNGGNASGWRADLLAVNGFDESMGYGSEDIELGVRLNHHGVRGRHLRYTAPLLHIEHPRAYADPAVMAANRHRVIALRRRPAAWTPQGIRKGDA